MFQKELGSEPGPIKIGFGAGAGVFCGRADAERAHLDHVLADPDDDEAVGRLKFGLDVTPASSWKYKHFRQTFAFQGRQNRGGLGQNGRIWLDRTLAVPVGTPFRDIGQVVQNFGRPFKNTRQGQALDRNLDSSG